MHNEDLRNQLLDDAIWAAGALFSRGRATGSSANLSFRIDGTLFISASGGCFGRLRREDFASVDLATLTHLDGPKPSKELPLHAILYRTNPDAGAVLHAHSHYATLWACLEHGREQDILPSHTPYLKMKLKQVDMVPYARPGSPELFAMLEERARPGHGYLLKNHGGLVAGKDMMDAFSIYEELEDSAWIAWDLLQNR